MPPLFLADNLPPELRAVLGDWMTILAFLIGITLGIMKLVSLGKNKPLIPSPVITQRQPEYVTQAEFKEVKSEVHEVRGKLESLQTKIAEVHLDLVQKGQERSEALSSRINDILLAVKAGPTNRKP